MGVDQLRGFVQAHAVEEPFVEELPKAVGYAAAGGPRRVRDEPGPQVAAQPLADQGETALRFQFVAAARQGRAQLSDSLPQQWVDQVGAIHRGADEALVQPAASIWSPHSAQPTPPRLTGSSPEAHRTEVEVGFLASNNVRVLCATKGPSDTIWSCSSFSRGRYAATVKSGTIQITLRRKWTTAPMS